MSRRKTKGLDPDDYEVFDAGVTNTGDASGIEVVRTGDVAPGSGQLGEFPAGRGIGSPDPSRTSRRGPQPEAPDKMDLRDDQGPSEPPFDASLAAKSATTSAAGTSNSNDISIIRTPVQRDTGSQITPFAPEEVRVQRDDPPVQPTKPSSSRRSTATTTPQPRSAFWGKVFPFLTLAMLIALPFIAWEGVQALDGVQSGTRRSGAPSFDAVVGTTPTALVVTLSDAGDAVAFSLLARSGRDGGGAVLVMPAEVVANVSAVAAPWDPRSADAERVAIRLGDAFDLGGPQGVSSAVEELLGIVVDRIIVLTAEDFERSIAPVIPLTIDNPLETVLQRRTIDEGRIALSGSEPVEYATHRGEAETEENRLLRHQLVWRAWISAVAGQGAEQSSPEGDTAAFEEVAHLSAGPTEFALFPFKRILLPDPDGEDVELDVPDIEALQAEVLRIVPFPAVLGGELPTVRVLSATGDLADGEAAASLLGNTGTRLRFIALAEPDVEGNPSVADESEIVYYDADDRDVALVVREALGGGSVVLVNGATASVDLTVVVGLDMAGALE